MPRRRSKPRFAPSSGSESMEYGADVEDVGVCLKIKFTNCLIFLIKYLPLQRKIILVESKILDKILGYLFSFLLLISSFFIENV